MHEENLLDLALFGMTNEEWKKQNPTKKGNIIDHASIFEVTTRMGMEALNKIMISKGADYDQRLAELNKFAKENLQRQMAALVVRGFINNNQKN